MSALSYTEFLKIKSGFQEDEQGLICDMVNIEQYISK